MSFKTTLKRIFTWDNRATRPNQNGEGARADSTYDAQVSGRSSGSDSTYGQRFTH